MALQTAPIVFRLQLKDRGGNIVPMVFKSNITSTVTANLMLNRLNTWVSGLTRAKIISATYTTGYYEDDLSVDATNGEVEERAEISCLLNLEPSGTPGQTREATITIPAPVDALFMATFGPLYNVVNPAYPGLQSLLNEYTTGLTGNLTLSDYQSIQDPTVPGNVEGKRIHKRSRKG